MDRDTPESLLQFMDNVTESVRAALERPVQDKEVNQSILLHKQLFDNQSDTKEQRRHKWHARRRRHRFPQQPKNSHQPDQWECPAAGPHQLQVLSKILGISDSTKHDVHNDQHLTEWEQNLHQSPNACREYNDDSAEGMLEWQGQFNKEPQQGSVTSPAASSQTDLPMYCRTEGQGSEMYSQMTETQFTYTHHNSPRSLDEALNMMPVGCHLPPPVNPSVSNFTAKRRPKQMDAASRRRKAHIMGVPESDGRYSPPQVTRTAQEGPPRSQNQYAEYCPNDVDLLSQLVTELDKTQILDKLTGESVFSQSPKEINTEDMRAIGRRYADKSNREPGERTDPSGFVYEDQKTCNGSNWGLLEWQGQFNMAPQQGSVTSPAASSHTDLPIYCQTEGQGSEMYSQMTETQFTYTHNNVSRTLDEVVNLMPVGCHLPPPVNPTVSNFTAKRRPKQMNAASRRRKAHIMGVPESDGRYSPPQVTRTARDGSQLSPLSQVEDIEYCPNEADLLSQIVTELDTTQSFDKLTGENTFQQSPKETYVEDMRSIGRRFADKSNRERTDPSGFVYEDEKACNGSNWGQFGSQAAKQNRFSTKQRSFDLACTLQETHQNSHRFPDNRNLHFGSDVGFGLNGLKRNSASMETLQFDTRLDKENTGGMQHPNNDVSFPKLRKSNLLIATKERRSMPNLYKHIHQQKCMSSSNVEHANVKFSNELRRFRREVKSQADSLEDFSSHGLGNGAMDLNGSVVPKRHSKLQDINWQSSYPACGQPLQSELNTV